jgi:hypothetical protein
MVQRAELGRQAGRFGRADPPEHRQGLPQLVCRFGGAADG